MTFSNKDIQCNKSAIMLSVFMLSDAIHDLLIVMLNVVTLSVVMLNVMAPFTGLHATSLAQKY